MIGQAVSAYIGQLPLRAILAQATAARMVDHSSPDPEEPPNPQDQLDPFPG